MGMPSNVVRNQYRQPVDPSRNNALVQHEPFIENVHVSYVSSAMYPKCSCQLCIFRVIHPPCTTHYLGCPVGEIIIYNPMD